jgi:hypothetical protein
LLALRGFALLLKTFQRLGYFIYPGLELMRPYRLSLIAEAYGRTGQPEAGLQVL